MDVFSDHYREQCWICDGTGRASLLADIEQHICAMCGGSGMATAMPATTSEMVAALLAAPGIPRKTFTYEDLQRINEIEQIVRTCMIEMRDDADGAA